MVPTWLITDTQTWTVPVTGNYRLICIGKGGDGGDGGVLVHNSSSSNNYYPYMFPSAAGGGGAVAIADRTLTVNDILNLNISDSQTDINGTALIATAGTDGIDGSAGTYYKSRYPSSVTYPTIPGGTASGTWLTYGYNGNNGESPETTVTYSTYNAEKSGYNSTPIYQGGNVGCIILTPAINGNAGMGAFNGPYTDGIRGYAYPYTGSGTFTSDDISDTCRTTLANGGHPGGGGAGAQSAVYYFTQSSGSTTLYSLSATGGKGGIGTILIQFLGE